MKKSGYTDLPLHYGKVPRWLYDRMGKLGGAIIESIVYEFGQDEVLKRLSDPFWFQSLGCVLGMDWHSSGITTSVMGALKYAINPISRELGIYICGGRGKHSRKTPDEILQIANRTGINGKSLVKCSRLCAKVDNNAVQDGYQIYLHNFILTDKGNWTIIQQGLNPQNKMARRYHWHSKDIKSFINDPHTSVYGENQGQILNLATSKASDARESILSITKENPNSMINEIKKLFMPKHHDVQSKDVNLKRLGAILALAYENDFKTFESLLLLEGLGPRTLQSLALVSEIIYGSEIRFSDPARFCFAHGGKDGHPFPVPIKVYDNSIRVLRKSIDKAKLGIYDKQRALKKLHDIALRIEKNNSPNVNFNKVIKKERDESHQYGGRTVLGKAKTQSIDNIITKTVFSKSTKINKQSKHRISSNQIKLF